MVRNVIKKHAKIKNKEISYIILINLFMIFILQQLHLLLVLIC